MFRQLLTLMTLVVLTAVGAHSRSCVAADTAQNEDTALPHTLRAEKSSAVQSRPEPKWLAAQIDRRIDAVLQAHAIRPVGPATDAEYLRRVTLDILGRIPTVAEARAFLDDHAVSGCQSPSRGGIGAVEEQSADCRARNFVLHKCLRIFPR